MICFKLTTKEIDRIKWAAEMKGFPWQAIVERPRTARRFLKRIEAEVARREGRPAGPFVFGAAIPAPA